MKTIYQKIRITDVYLQFIIAYSIALLAIVYAFQEQNSIEFFLPYFVVGACQLISYCIQLFKGGWKQNLYLKTYSYILLAYVIMLIPPLTFLGLVALLFTSPVVALVYPFLNMAAYNKQFFFDPYVSENIENTEIKNSHEL